MEESINPSINSAPPALVFFCADAAAVEPNFYRGWCRSAMVMKVGSIVDHFGWRWKEG